MYISSEATCIIYIFIYLFMYLYVYQFIVYATRPPHDFYLNSLDN